MPRTMRTSRTNRFPLVEEISEDGGSPRATTRNTRKRDAEEDKSDESPEPRQKQRRTSEDGGSGGPGDGGSGSGVGGGGSGSGRRRSSGFADMGSQDADEAPEESYGFTDTQDVARARVAKAAAQPSKEVLMEAKDEKKASELSSGERVSLVKSMMRFLLMKGLSHEPATRKEMMDSVLGPRYRGKGVLKYVLSKADSRLKTAVGFRVKTVHASKPYYVKDTYYVVNALNHALHSKEILKGPGQAARGLLTTVLCVIYCSVDKIVTEDDLFIKLHTHVDKRIPKRNVLETGRSATKTKNRVVVEGLGDVHDLLATFVKQHYLMKKVVKKATVEGGTDMIPAYVMGARAALEVGNMQILTLMAETMGQTVDPASLVELEDEEGSQNLSQAMSQG